MYASVTAAQSPKRRKKSQLAEIWRRYRKNKLAMLGLIVFLAMAVLAILVSIFGNYESAIEQTMQIRYLPPSLEHLFGTDQYGRDIFMRMLFGARISLFVGLIAVAISLSAGALIGAVAGYYGGRVDDILMRIMDIFLAIPSTLLAISIVAALGTNLLNLLLAMAISYMPSFARIVRSSILTVKSQEYIEAARACGTSTFRIILRHIIPNAMGPIIVQATLTVARIILGISSLSFVGLGIQPPTPEWGTMLSEGQSQMRYHPYLILIPGAAIALAVMALNLIGDGLRDALDPRLKN